MALPVLTQEEKGGSLLYADPADCCIRSSGGELGSTGVDEVYVACRGLRLAS